MKIAFFELEGWEKPFLQNSLSEHEISFIDGKLDKDHLPNQKDADILSVFIGSQISPEVLQGFPNLKFITTRSTGFDHIDLKACQEKNILVANVPTYGANTVAEHAFALILGLSRKIYYSYERLRETGSFSLDGLRGFDLKGKTLGVIGTGHIGRHTIRIAKGFEMKILAYDPFPDLKLAQELDFEYKEKLDDLLGNSDIITLHAPLNEQTHHLINGDNIYKIKKGAYLINTARGGLVDTDALVKALKEKHLAGAALDVLEEEGAIKEELELLTSGKVEEHNIKTLLQNHVLIDMPNVIITPHNAFNSQEALQRILKTTVENIKAFASKQPQNIVNNK